MNVGKFYGMSLMLTLFYFISVACGLFLEATESAFCANFLLDVQIIKILQRLKLSDWV